MKRDAVFIDADPTTGLPAMSALELRGLLNCFQAGVLGATELKVTAGTGLSVDSGAGRGLVFASGSGVSFPGLYYCVDDASENSAAFDGGGIPSNVTTTPRLDAVVVRVYDDGAGDGSGRREWVRQYVPGTPAVGAALGGTLPTLPASSLLIAEVLVPGNNPSSIPSTNIRDRRPWARGAFRAITRNANAAGGNDYTTTSLSPALVDGTNLNPRLELSGSPVTVEFSALVVHSVANGRLVIYPMLDGAVWPGTPSFYQRITLANSAEGASFVRTLPAPSAGSHTVGLAFAAVEAGTVTLRAQATNQVSFTVREEPRQNANN